MAMRRRIKVGVNLSAGKRKTKSEPNEPNVEDKLRGADTIKIEDSKRDIPESQPKIENVKSEPIELKTDRTDVTEAPKDDNAFKCPPKVEFIRSTNYTTANHSSDESNQSELNDGAQVMQMDLQRGTTSFPMSPTKIQQRQRIKATPIFGHRRNSHAGSSQPSIIDCETSEPSASPQRRERHYSGSQNNMPANNNNITNNNSRQPGNTGTGRIRTESTCSALSDSHCSVASKSRKIDDQNSHRSHSRRDFEARFCNGVPEKSSLKMSDLIYYNPITNPMEKKQKIDQQMKTETKDEVEEETNAEAEAATAVKNNNNNNNNDSSSVLVPQLKLNAKGELILDDKSLEIETTAEQEARKVLAKSSLIYLDENTGMNGFYKRQKRTREWPADETIRFYRCLKTIGTDFSMMCQLFPKRTRRDLKLKFKKEERSNGALINKALLHPSSFDIQDLKSQFEIEDRKREEEERTKIEQKAVQFKKIVVRTSKSARALKHADDILHHKLQSENSEKNVKKEITDADAAASSKKKPKRKRQANKTKSKKTQNTSSEPLSDEHVTKESHEIEAQNVETTLMNGSRDIPSPPSTIISENCENIDSPPRSKDNNLACASKEESLSDYEYMDEHENFPSRTFVNMDSGMLIEDFDTPYDSITEGNDVEEGGECSEFINENEVLYTPSPLGDDLYTGTEQDPTYEQTLKMEDIKHPPAAAAAAAETNSPGSSNCFDQNDEMQIAKILEDIANGSLVLCSTYNPASPDEEIYEVYMVNENSGELSDDPLDLPPEIVQSILSVMTES